MFSRIFQARSIISRFQSRGLLAASAGVAACMAWGAGDVVQATSKSASATPASTPVPSSSVPEEKKPQMPYRRLGGTGLFVSLLSFGAWVTMDKDSEEVAEKCIEAAWEHGVNFFDNAEGYAQGRAETLMGKALKKMGLARKDFVVSTKIFWGGSGPNDVGLSRKHIIEGLDASLARLQLSYVDLIFCHRPDPHTPIEETVRAMNHVINQGKALYWGTSEWSAAQISEACAIADRLNLIPPAMEQPQYNMLMRNRVESEYADLYEVRKLGTTIWSPLASGVLTGKYNAGTFPPGSRLANEKLQWLKDQFTLGSRMGNWEGVLATTGKINQIASRLGCTPAQLAIAWACKNKNVSTVITGASSVAQVEENMKALAVVDKLTPEVMADIDAILGNKPAQLRDWTGRTK